MAIIQHNITSPNILLITIAEYVSLCCIQADAWKIQIYNQREALISETKDLQTLLSTSLHGFPIQ